MLIFRWAVLMLLIAGVLCFGMYVGTGQVQWRRRGLKVVTWAVLSGLAFFAVLILERVAVIF
jgi:hypothetical protein